MSNSQDKTPITWRHPHFWWDSLVLLLTWFAAVTLPDYYYKVPVATILKIVALVGTLEMASFVAYQLFGNEKGMYLQGFLGGFASSTTVFVQMTRDKRFSHLSQKTLTLTLLFATLAMLIETFIIGIGLAAPIKILTMIVFQAFIILLFIYRYWEKQNIGETSKLNFQIDHPIIWLRVLKLAFFILALITVMKLITIYMPTSESFAVLLTSLFEAHAVFAAVLLKEHQNSIYYLYLLVALGSVLSKLFLVWRSEIAGILTKMIYPLTIGIIGAALITLF